MIHKSGNRGVLGRYGVATLLGVFFFFFFFWSRSFWSGPMYLGIIFFCAHDPVKRRKEMMVGNSSANAKFSFPLAFIFVSNGS